MNSEIKFRAWDGEQNRMVYWTLNDLLCRVGEDEYRDERKDCSPFFKWMKYTGFKNHKEVDLYEGDIFGLMGRDSDKPGQYEIHGIVYFNENFATFCVMRANGGFDFLIDCMRDPNTVKEIIGNIHENPELLTKKP